MLKYASTQIMSRVLAPVGVSRRELRRFAHRHQFQYEVRPGFLYVRSRAISSRTNDNFDTFPAEELEKSYATFKGKPVFVNHVNHDHRRARGVIIDAALHKDSNRDGSRDWWVEVLQEVDAVRFPRLAKEIIAGNIARTSMGTDVAYSICSVCGNKATTPAEYCSHIPAAKGQRLYRTTASGRKEGILIHETCYGLRFFENSLLVEPPADPTAFFTGVDTSGLDKKATKDPRFAEVGIGEDDDGHYVKTHRARSDSYPTPEDIPDSVVKQIAATGAKNPGGYRIDHASPNHETGLPYHEVSGQHGPDDQVSVYRAVPKRVSRINQGDWVSLHGDWTQERADSSPNWHVLQAQVPAKHVFVDRKTKDTDEAGYGGPHMTGPSVRVRGANTPEQPRLFEGRRKLAYGETKAPEDVDTLREDSCPVCGDRDTYDGATCAVCAYVSPPKIFQDPDLELARQMDLRKDISEFNGQPGQPVDPNALDAQGNPMPGAAPGEQPPGSLPGEIQAEVQTAADGSPGMVPGQDGQMIQQPGEVLDPAMLGPDGQPLQQGQQMIGPDGMPLPQQGQQPMLGPDGMPIGPQPLPGDAMSGDGQPFNPGPNMPQGPGGPEAPLGPEDLDSDGQVSNPEAGQGVPGTPEDGVPDLMCPACGFTADATQPVSIDMDTANLPDAGVASQDGVTAGDICPNCGTGLLLSPAEVQGETPVPSPV
jgi:hypothetical protein